MLRFWKENNSEQWVGLDIKSDSISLLKINSANGVYEVEVYASHPLPKDTFEKGELKEISAVGSAIRNLVRSVDKRIGYVALAVPRASVIVKTISVSRHLNSSEIEARAWVEANHHFPDLVGEIYLDFNIIGPSEENPSNNIDLMLVACRTDQIQPYLDALKEGGLTPDVIDVNSYALERALSLITANLPSLNTFALLNLDSHLSSLIVSHQGNIIFAHDHVYDDHKLTSAIQAYLNPENKDTKTASPEEIDALKKTLTSHLRHIVHFFYSSRSNITIQTLFISGDFSKIPWLVGFVQEEIGIETQLANPFATMTLLPSVDAEKLKKDASTLMLACGLALTKDPSLNKSAINLLPWREKKRKKKKIEFFTLLGLCLGATILLIILIHFYLNSLITLESERVQYLQTTLSEKQAEYSQLLKKKKKQSVIEADLKFVMSLREKSFQAVRLLNELVKIVPPTVTLQKLVRDGNQLVLEGKAQSELQVTQLIKNASRSPIFNQPVLTRISAPSNDTETGKVFQLKIEQKDFVPQ